MQQLYLRSCQRPLITALVLALAVALLARGGTATTVVNLGAETWSLVNGNESISLTTTLPAYPLEVLYEQGVIGDPMWR
jgi:hypothetical protein